MNIKAFWALIGAMVLSFSCSKDGLFQQSVSVDTRDGAALSIQDLDFDIYGQKVYKVAFTADKDWTVYGVPTWLSVEPSSGTAGTKTLTIKVLLPSTDESDRSAELYFRPRNTGASSSSGESLAVIKISQPKVHFGFAEKIDSISFSWHDYHREGVDEPNLTLNTNVYWRMESEKGIYSSVQEGDIQEDEPINLQVMPSSANLGKDSLNLRVSFIPLKPKELGSKEFVPFDGVDPINIVLNQANLKLIVNWDENTKLAEDDETAAIFSELGPDVVIDQPTEAVFSIDSEEKWKITECPEWVSLSIDGRIISMEDTIDPGQNIVRASITDPNPSSAPRPGSIKIVPVIDYNVQDAEAIINVRQRPFVFEVFKADGAPLSSYGCDFKNDDLSIPDEAETYEIILKTCGPIEEIAEFGSVPSWLDPISEALQDNSYSYRIKFKLKEQNLKFTEESTYPTDVVISPSKLFKDSELKAFEKRFSFKQAAFEFIVDLPDKQKIGGQELTISELPPALTAEKMRERYSRLFSLTIKKTSGPWQLTDESSKWIQVCSDSSGAEEVREGKKCENIDLYFAPSEANQKDNDAANVGQIQIVSYKHLERAGDLSKVEKEAIKTFKVVQRGFTFKVFPAGKDVKVFDDVPAYSKGFEDLELSLDIKCDGNWEIREKEIPAFLSLVNGEKLSGDGTEGDYTVRFRPKPNVGGMAKNGSITVYCTDRNNQPETVSIRQEAFKFELKGEDKYKVPAYVADPLPVDFEYTDGVELSFIDESDGKWLSASLLGSSVDNGVMSASYGFKPQTWQNMDKSRTGSVKVSVVKPSGVDKQILLSFTQNEFLYSVPSDEIRFDELPDGERQIEIISSGPWTVNRQGQNSDWFSVEPLSGEGSEEPQIITLKAGNNTETEANKASIQVVVPSVSRSREIPVSQSPFKWSVSDASGTSLDYSLGTLEKRTININVVSSGPWKVDAPDWLTVSPSEGPGDMSGKPQLVQIKSAVNLEEAREQTFAFKSKFFEFNDKLSTPVSVEQDKFIWEVESADWSDLAGGGHSMEWADAINKSGKSLSITSSGTWKIVDASSGANVSSNRPADGWRFNWNEFKPDQASNVEITPLVNNSWDRHETKFDIVSVEHEAEGIEKKVQVTLAQPAFILNVAEGEDNLKFAPWNTDDESAPQQRTLHVSHIGDWELVASPSSSWVRPANASKDAVDIIVENYNKDEERNAELTLKSKVDGITLTRPITVTQNAFVFAPENDSDIKISFDAVGGTRRIPIKCSANWNVKSFTSGIVSRAERLPNSNLLSIDISGYDGTAPRAGTVVLESHGAELTISVSQGSYKFDIIGDLSENAAFEFSPDASEKVARFTLTSNVNWSLELPDWLKLVEGVEEANPNNAEGVDYHFSIEPKDDNESDEARIGKVVFENSVTTVEYNVRQEGFMMGEVILDTFAAYEPSAQTVELHSSIPWTVDNGTSRWIRVSQSEGDKGPATIQILVDNNYGDQRRGEVLIKNAKYGVSRTIKVSQYGFVWSVTPNSLEFPAKQQGSGSAINVKSSAPCIVNCSEEWLDYSPKETVAGQETKVLVAPKDNLTKANRSAAITITAVVNGEVVKSHRVDVTQHKYVFDVEIDGKSVGNGYKLYFDNKGDSQHEVRVKSSGKWDIRNIPDWVNLEKKQGDSVVLRASNNDTEAAREAEIMIACEDNPDHNVTITIVQDVFRIANDNFSAFSEVSAEVQSFDLYSSRAWNVSCDKEWVHINPSAGSAIAGKVGISVDDNYTESVRDATVTVSCNQDNGAIKPVTFSIKQNAYRFNVRPLSFSFDAANPSSGNLSMDCSSRWSVSEKPDWITILDSDNNLVGEGASGSYTLRADPNYSRDPRPGSLKLVSVPGGIERIVEVSQAAYEFSVDKTELSFSPDGGALSVEVQCAEPDQVLCDITSGGWINYIKTTDAGGKAVFSFTAAPNTGDTPREESVEIVSARNDSIKETIRIKQDVFFISTNELSFDASGSASSVFSIITSSSWEASSEDPWITIEPANGTGEAQVTVSVSENLEKEARTGYIVVKYEAAGYSGGRKLTVVQGGKARQISRIKYKENTGR